MDGIGISTKVKMVLHAYRKLYTKAHRAARAAVQSAEAPSSARMLAWRLHGYGGLDELRLEEARLPALRAPDELLVRVHTASLNPLDVAMIGGYGARLLNILRSLDGSEGVEFPLVPGRDFAGTVERAGPSSRLRRGDFVWGVVPPHRPGSHAQYVTVKDQWVGMAPSTLSAASAGGALYAALTATALLRAAGVPAGSRAAPGERVLVLGLGGVGTAALQLLAHRGTHAVVGCAAELHERARALGAADALDRHAPEYERELVDRGPYEAVLDCAGLGGEEAAAHAWRFRRYATLTTPLLRRVQERGAALGGASAAAQLAAQTARALRSQPAGCPPPHVRWAYFAPCASDVALLRALAERGAFAVPVERVYPWRDASSAYERAATGHARGKLVLDFNSQ